jgi:hypothetical protein
MEDIRAITNKHFNQMINKSPNDIYITVFFLNLHESAKASLHNYCLSVCHFSLHPDHRGAQIFKNINPLSIPAVVLRTTNSRPNPGSSSMTPENKIMVRVGLALQQILKNEYGDAYTGSYPDPVAIMQGRSPLLAGISPMDALSCLKDELKGYVKGQEPFNRRFRDGETVLSWWTTIQKDDFARVLGVCALSCLTCGSPIVILMSFVGPGYQNLFCLCGLDGRRTDGFCSYKHQHFKTQSSKCADRP